MNRRTGRSRPFPLYFPGNNLIVVLGKGEVIAPATFHAVVIDNRPFVTVHQQGHHVAIDVTMLDRDGNLRLSIVENELSFATDAYDITFIKNRLTATGPEPFAMVFEPEHQRVVIENGSFYYNGADIQVRRGHLYCQANENEISFEQIGGFTVGFHVGLSEPSRLGPCGVFMALRPQDRYWWNRQPVNDRAGESAETQPPPDG